MKRIILIIISVLVINSIPASAESLKDTYQKAEKYFSEGKYEEAIRCYEKAININPNLAEAYNKLGLAYRELNMDPAEIAWYFKTAIEIKPDFVDAYINLARAYYGLGRFDEAEKNCLKALSLNPRALSAQLSLAWIYLLGKQEPAKAITYFEKVLARSKIPYAYFGLGMAYFMNNQREMMLEVITALRGMNEDNFAQQLEDMVRGHYYAPSEGGPLINKVPRQEKQKGIIVPAAYPKTEEEPKPEVAKSPAGIMKIRLKGTLTNQVSGENSKDAGNIRLQGTPSVIQPSQLRSERIKMLREQSSETQY